MRSIKTLSIGVALFAGAIGAGHAVAADARKAVEKYIAEDYVIEPMPAGFQIVGTELEGPVFANAEGKTVYTWPVKVIRNAATGDRPNAPSICNDDIERETIGYNSPYPAGSELPDANHRPTCEQHWPAVLASSDAQPVGNFKTITRKDGTKQWAYKGYPLYTSHLDTRRGDTVGGSHRHSRDGHGGVKRLPALPPAAVPPQFKVMTVALGQMVVTDTTMSVYTYDKDTATKSNCSGTCLDRWKPIVAPDFAVSRGMWSTIVRDDGIKQWVYRGKPVYTYNLDPKENSVVGSDEPGWNNVYLHRAPSAPKGFQLVDTRAGQVLATPEGKTIYFYKCAEDTAVTLQCEDLDSPQEYRLAMCGKFDVDRCLRNFPYVVADKNAKSDSMAWSVIYVNPRTGRAAKEDDAGALRVWAFRNKPIYTFSGDRKVGDIEADSWGQDHGHSNGYTAFWVRDDFKDLAS